MNLSQLTWGEIWPVVIGAGTVVSGLVWMYKAMHSFQQSIDEKQAKGVCGLNHKAFGDALEHVKDEMHAMFSDMRIEIREELHKRAKQSDIIELSTRVTSNERLVAIVQAQMQNLLESMHRLENKMDRILEGSRGTRHGD